MTPVFSWLQSWRSEQLQGTLVDIFTTPEAGGVMCRFERIEAVSGLGLAGDRYLLGRGHWKLTDGCQVTLIAEEDLRKAEQHSGLDFSEGQHRRNLVVRGIPIAAFRQRQVRIGAALFAYHRLRPPCGYLDRLVGSGAGKALGRGAGIGLKVVQGGIIQLGDPVTVLVQTHNTDSNTDPR